MVPQIVQGQASLPGLDPSQMQSAVPLALTPAQTTPQPATGYAGLPYDPAQPLGAWDASVDHSLATLDPAAANVFSFHGEQGAKLQFQSVSGGPPSLIQIYDAQGHPIAAGDSLLATIEGAPPGICLEDFHAPYSGTYYVTPGWNPGTGSPTASLRIWEDVDTRTAVGTAQPDVIQATRLADYIDAGAGTDTVTYDAPRSQFSAYQWDGDVHVQWFGGLNQDNLVNVERLQFTDKMVAFDDAGPGGELHRLYHAVLEREPDLQGMGYWIKLLDEHALPLTQVASLFTGTAEFAQTWLGMASSPAQFVTRAYQSVLGRAADPEGYAFFANALQNGAAVSDVLYAFSESPEYQAKVIGFSGVEYLPYQ